MLNRQTSFLVLTTMTKILLIRHALTPTAGKQLTGRTPGIFLTEEGKLQAQKLAKYLTAIPISAIYSSPLERALETAAPIAESHHLNLIISKDFQEIDFGYWTNFTIEALKNDIQFKAFNQYRSGTRIPGGELFLETQTRIVQGLEKIRKDWKDNIVAVISHADTIRAALAHYTGIAIDLIHRVDISPASVSIIELYDETVRIKLINGRAELVI
jgi:probable phosphoglycerate mutase